MKVLMLVQADHGSTAFEALYEEMSKHYELFDLRWLKGEEQANLQEYFLKKVDIEQYDRIVSVIRFKKEIKQSGFFKKLPNLVFLEYDACQNYMSDSKYKGVFSRHYKKISHAKVISSGYDISEKLCKEGIDATFVPKGFDDSIITDLGLERDIELGFVGNTRSKTYKKRREFLEDLERTHGLKIKKTLPGNPYNEMLNRIKYFISADVGIGEYMQKNFEAMAAGCVVFAYDQGEIENSVFGFKDMENIVLYKNKNELLEKVNALNADNELAHHIVHESKIKARDFSYRKIALLLKEAIESPTKEIEVRVSLLNRILRGLV